MQNRLKGLFTGLFLGDSLGAPFEFRYSLPLDKYTGRLEHRAPIQFQFQPKRYTVIGQVTDDSTFSIVLFLSLIQNNGYNRKSVIESYLKLCNEEKYPFLGKNTRMLLRGVTTLRGYENRIANLVASGNVPQSNGSLMRISPIAFLFDKLPPDQVIQTAIVDTDITNPCPVNREATFVYIALLYNIYIGIESETSLNNLLQNTLASLKESSVRDAIVQAMTRHRREVSGQTKGWVCHALYCAVLSLILAVRGASFTEIIDYIICLSGDTDTNGAIAGALLGFYFGYNKMIESPITRENIRIVLAADYSQGDFPVSEIYHPRTVFTRL